MGWHWGILAASGAGAAGAYEHIASTVLSTTSALIEFASIPQTYKHLQIRGVARVDITGTSQLRLALNNDFGTNYARHRLIGSGSSVTSDATTVTNYGLGLAFATDSQAANAFAASVSDLLDYANTSKNTTMRGLGGLDGINIALASGLWLNTAAVTRITITPAGGNFVSGSRFSLYGIKG